MAVRRRALSSTVWVIYLVIVLEFLFMISPVALHFYSSYGPVLNLFHRSTVTAWLTGFFLPHFSETDSWLLNAVKPLGFQLAFVGLLFFVIGALQVYTAKIFRRGAVTGGLYRWVRHPQYLALAVLGLGVTLIWARFLVLASYVTMLFLYAALAIWEEKLCLEKYGESYRELQQRTGMILPSFIEKLFKRRAQMQPEWGWRRWAATYAVVLVVALGLGFGAREYSLRHISAYFTGNTAVLSPAMLSAGALERAFQLAQSDPLTHRELLGNNTGTQMFVYVVPESWFMPDLPLHSEEEIRRIGGGHLSPADFDRGRYKLLFARARTHKPDATGRALVRTAYGLEPMLIVHLDLEAGEIERRVQPPTSVIWGDIPTPLF